MLYRLSYLATMKTQRFGERPALRLPWLVAEPTGFEPATFCVTGRYANRYTTAPSFRFGIAILLPAAQTRIPTQEKACQRRTDVRTTLGGGAPAPLLEAGPVARLAAVAAGHGAC